MPPRSKTQSGKRRQPQRGATGRNASPSKNQNAQKSNNGLFVLGAIAGVIIGGLAVAMWYETRTAPPPSTVAEAADCPEPKAPTPAPRASRDSSPKPGSEFYHELPNAEVETFAEGDADGELKQYVLQAGAFRARSDADALEARIALDSGLEAWVDERVSSSGSLWYRVRLGPYEGKRASDRAKRQLWERLRVDAVRYLYQPNEEE